MNRLKKLLSFTLALLMLVSVLPLSAVAEDATEPADEYGQETLVPDEPIIVNSNEDPQPEEPSPAPGEESGAPELPPPEFEEPLGDNGADSEIPQEDIPSVPADDTEPAPQETESPEEEVPQEEETAEQPPFIIIYHSNFNNYSEELTFSQQFEAGEPVVTAFNGFSLENGSFIGWNTSPLPFEQPGTAYGENEPVDIALYPEGMLELYAQWQLHDNQLRLYFNSLYSRELGTDAPKAKLLAIAPEYEGGAVPFADAGIQASTDGEAALILRDAMIRRASTCVINVQNAYGENARELGENIVYEALRHTGKPKEGDYITWQGLGISSTENTSSGVTSFAFTITYVTTAAQEAQVDSAVASAINSLGLRSMASDAEKVIAVHDWICDLVTYDSSTDITHTAYAAICGNHHACCQGYSQLFYRFMCELGIDSRLVSGEAYIGGDGGGHAWNIVKLDGRYYYLDATWDDDSGYIWFLKGSSTFELSHFCETFYLDALADNREYFSAILDNGANVRCYNMSPTDYDFCDTGVTLSEYAVTVNRSISSSFSVSATLTPGSAGSNSGVCYFDYGDFTCTGWSCSNNVNNITFTVNNDGVFYIVFSCVSNGNLVGKTAMLKVTATSSGTTGRGVVSFDTSGGSELSPVVSDQYGTVCIPTEIPTRTGCSFMCWEDEEGYWYAPGAYLHNIFTATTLTAVWTYDTVYVSFDGNGGSVPANKSVCFGSPYGTMPSSSRSDYVFQGWYTSRNGGSLITADTIVTRTVNHKLYAHWKQAAPVISSQPSDVTVRENSNASFSVTVTGTGYSLRWQKSSDNKLTWADINGATSATYSLSPSKSMDGTYYRCVVTYDDGAISSNPARLTVKGIPVISSQPADIAVRDGSAASFSVSVSGDDYSLQWQQSLDNKAGWTNISGASSATLNLTAAMALNGAFYRCKVSYDDKSIDSNAACLTVKRIPVISSQPVSVTAKEGSSVTFSIGSTGDDYSFRWQQSLDNKASWTDVVDNLPDVSGAAGDALSLYAVKALNGAYFRCLLCYDGNELASEPALLALIPTVGSLPEYVTLNAGESFALPVSYADAQEFSALSSFFSGSWSLDIQYEGDSSCATVASSAFKKLAEGSCSFATVNGVKAGTCWATVTVKAGESSVSSSRLRIDVLPAGGVQTEVTGVSLGTKKATVELYSTSYTRLEVLLKSSGLTEGAPTAVKGDVVVSEYAEPLSTGHSIESAQFTDPTAAALFDLRVTDDRQLEIVPKYSTVTDSWAGTLKIKGSCKTAVSVKLSGCAEPMSTGVITLAIKKSLPKPKAAAVVFNTLASGCVGSTETIRFTGAKVVSVDEAIFAKSVAWASVSPGDMTVSYLGAQRYKGSCKATLLCRVEGWAVSVPVALNITAVNKAPTVKLKVTGSIEKNLPGSYALITASVSNGTAVSYSLDSVVLGKGTTQLKDSFSFDPLNMRLSLKPKASLAKGSYTALFSATMRDGTKIQNIKLSIKLTDTALASLKPKLSLSAKAGELFIYDRHDETCVKLSCNQASLPDIGLIRLDSKSSARFELKSFDPNTGLVVIGWKQDAVRSFKPNSSASVKLEIFLEGNDPNAPKAKPNASLSYKIVLCEN